MVDTKCYTCTHVHDMWGGEPPNPPMEWPRYICTNPKIMNYVKQDDWRRRESMIDANACRVLACLCGQEASWYEPNQYVGSVGSNDD